MVIIAFDHNRTAVQERNDLIGHLSEILLLYFTKRAKMIVDMLFAWLRQTTDTEHDLAGKIIPLIIVQTFIDRNIMLQLGNAQRADTFDLFQVTLLFLNRAHNLAKFAQVFIHKAMNRAVESVGSEVQHVTKLVATMFTEQRKSFTFVLCLT